MRKTHKKNTDTSDDIVEAKVSSDAVEHTEPDSIYLNGSSSVMEEDEDEDGDLGLKARALYDYQAGEILIATLMWSVMHLT